MSKYYYPAIFTEEKNGYSVTFPDLEGCFTCGDDLQDSLTMATDVLSCYLCDCEIEARVLPKPSDLKLLKTGRNEFASYIICDTDEYKRKYRKVAVKKTLTIPEWLNEAALVRNVNFSQVLQDALLEIVNQN